MKVTVYCASGAKINEVYFDAAKQLAKELVRLNIDITFGGGAFGLMGTLADTVIELGGKIKGIMPKFMNEIEWAHPRVTDFEFTETMHERKEKLRENADALIALPGGCGTLEELLEAITLKRLGLFTKPIIILNTNNFYEYLHKMLLKCADENFFSKEHLKMWTFVNQPEEVIPAISSAVVWDEEAIKFALNK